MVLVIFFYFFKLDIEEKSGNDVDVSNTLNKVNSSEFDPLKDKIQPNGIEEVKEAPKPTPTPPVSSNNDPQSGQPQPGPGPVLPIPQGQPIASTATSHHNLNEYYNRTTPSYPQMGYGSVPYPQQQYAYAG